MEPIIPIKIPDIGRLKRVKDTCKGNRKTIMLTGYSGAGKTTILTVLWKGDDVIDKEIINRTTGIERHHIEFKTDDGKILYIRGDDPDGSEKVFNDEKFEKKLRNNHYIIHLLNVNRFVNGHNKSENEKCLALLQEVGKFAKKHNKPMLLVLSHADEYLESIREEKPAANESDIRDLFFSPNGYLSNVKFDCKSVVANVQKYNDVKVIIETLIRLKS